METFLKVSKSLLVGVEIDDFLITHKVNISPGANRESNSGFLKINQCGSRDALS